MHRVSTICFVIIVSCLSGALAAGAFCHNVSRVLSGPSIGRDPNTDWWMFNLSLTVTNCGNTEDIFRVEFFALYCGYEGEGRVTIPVGETRILHILVLTEGFFQPWEACELIGHVVSLGIYGWGPSIYLPEWPTLPPTEIPSSIPSFVPTTLPTPVPVFVTSTPTELQPTTNKFVPITATGPSPTPMHMLTMSPSPPEESNKTNEFVPVTSPFLTPTHIPATYPTPSEESTKTAEHIPSTDAPSLTPTRTPTSSPAPAEESTNIDEYITADVPSPSRTGRTEIVDGNFNSVHEDTFTNELIIQNVVIGATIGVVSCSVALSAFSRYRERIAKERLIDYIDPITDESDITRFVMANQKSKAVARKLIDVSGDHTKIVVVALSLSDFVADGVLVYDQVHKHGIVNDGTINVIPLCSAVFLVLPALGNLAFILSLFHVEFRNEKLKKWFHQNSTVCTICVVLGIANPEVLSILVSASFGYIASESCFNAPFTKKGKEMLLLGGLISTFLEDLPQMIIQAFIFDSDGFTTVTLIAIVTSAVTLLLSLTRRCLTCISICTRHEPAGRPESVRSSYEMNL